MALPSLQSRFEGCLLGGAIGDALGAPVEFQNAHTIFATYGPKGITDLPQPGTFTDDTQMTLFTAEGLISAVGHQYLQMPPQGSSPKITKEAISMLHQSYLRWLATQQMESKYEMFSILKSSGWLVSHKELHRREAPGKTCLSALASGRIGSRTETLNNSKGCGGVMRVAPAALIVHGAWPEETADRKAALAYEIGCAAAAITHSHPAGYHSGGMLAAIISYVLSGEELLRAVELSCEILGKEKNGTETLDCIRLSVRLGIDRKAKLEAAPKEEKSKGSGVEKLIAEEIESIGGGWVGEEALGIALYCCILAGRDFEAGLIWSVNHTGDSDSTGAIAGNILGALLGSEGIPARWPNGVDMSELVKEVASDLYSATNESATNYEYPGALRLLKSGKYPRWFMQVTPTYH
ncbi:hypothetical protein KFL_001590180 [Klebsormidium nitens]|uniref:ADP-ribosylhydrolase ARH3 n=1 Tax=Klebsormidium nitens TaxID=105231 RepID=A0A1Y1HYK1_KLENI|nr:hypothetical protein KFL_001590180 [Klebsormidium nitens]|eukprot:GAQ83730.1 hypothetical protein KFL_001590180 [Klebsormidium nitens]